MSRLESLGNSTYPAVAMNWRGVITLRLFPVLLVFPTPALEYVHLFDPPTYQEPTSAILRMADGSFYGVAGMSPSVLYRLAADGSVTNIATFNSTISGGFAHLFTNTTGQLHGVFVSGGPERQGAMFRLETDRSVRLLAVFQAEANGAFPWGPFWQAADGNFYGTTTRGGEHGDGALLKVTAEGAITRIFSFESASGAFPVGNLVEGSDGRLYGVCHRGGEYGRGVIFEFVPGGTVSTVLSFDGTEGGFPLAGLLSGRDGHLYGTTAEIDIVDESGQGPGTIFRVDFPGRIETLARFETGGPRFPRAALVQTEDGRLYGTLSDLDDDSDFVGTGGIFALDPATGGLNVHRFDQSSGRPFSGVIDAADGTLLAVTQRGGLFGAGELLRVAADGLIAPIYSFPRVANPPHFPLGGVTIAENGDLFGTTVSGGDGYGAVYRLTRDGAFSILHSFNGVDGDRAERALSIFSDGNLYGTTHSGGALGLGTLFRVSPAGEFQSLASFDGSSGSRPASDLVEGPDGQIYGVTLNGKQAYQGKGVLYRASKTGTISTVFNLEVLQAFITPASSLISDGDGGLFGTAAKSASSGVIYQLAKDGRLTITRSFGQEQGGPPGPIVLSSSGALYGLTEGVPPDSPPVLFKLVPGNAPVILAVSDLGQGAIISRLLFGKDGALYGTFQDGWWSDGSLFRFTEQGGLSTLHSFSSPRYPSGALALGPDGSIYGTASSGGFGGGGIFKLNSPVWIAADRAANGIVLTWPAAFDDFQVQASPNLLGQAWIELPSTPVRVGENLTVTIPASLPSGFLRLVKKPPAP